MFTTEENLLIIASKGISTTLAVCTERGLLL
jgi:hypothetical protein